MADYQQNFLASLHGGMDFGQRIKQQRDQSQLNQLAAQSYSTPPDQRDSLLAQMAGVDAGSAFQAEKQMAYSDERRNTNMVNMARLLVNAPEQARPALYQSMVPTLSRFGLSDLPKQYDAQTTGPVIMQAAQSLVQAYQGGGSSSQNKVIGDALVGPQGNILYQAERQPEYMWSDRAGAWIPNPNNALISQRQGHAQGTPANPLEQGGTQAQVDADAALANEMIAAGISDAQVDAFLAARMNPNGGSAVAASSGSLEPVRVAGVGPKPEISAAEQIRLDMAREAGARADRAEARADRNEQRQVAANSVSGRTPNEGERNASGFYQRMVAANAELKRLTDAGYDPTNLRDHLTVGSAVGNYLASNEGQQYNQAAMNWVRANLRKESGAAIGVDEARQEIRNYFPQPGDSPEVVQQKANNRLVVEQAMLQAAGRAAPQRGTAPSNAGGWSIQRIE